MCFHVYISVFRCSYLERSEGISTAAQCSQSSVLSNTGRTLRAEEQQGELEREEMGIILCLSGVFD